MLTTQQTTSSYSTQCTRHDTSLHIAARSSAVSRDVTRYVTRISIAAPVIGRIIPSYPAKDSGLRSQTAEEGGQSPAEHIFGSFLMSTFFFFQISLNGGFLVFLPATVSYPIISRRSMMITVGVEQCRQLAQPAGRSCEELKSEPRTVVCCFVMALAWLAHSRYMRCIPSPPWAKHINRGLLKFLTKSTGRNIT